MWTAKSDVPNEEKNRLNEGRKNTPKPTIERAKECEDATHAKVGRKNSTKNPMVYLYSEIAHRLFIYVKKFSSQRLGFSERTDGRSLYTSAKRKYPSFDGIVRVIALGNTYTGCCKERDNAEVDAADFSIARAEFYGRGRRSKHSISLRCSLTLVSRPLLPELGIFRNLAFSCSFSLIAFFPRFSLAIVTSACNEHFHLLTDTGSIIT